MFLVLWCFEFQLLYIFCFVQLHLHFVCVFFALSFVLYLLEFWLYLGNDLGLFVYHWYISHFLLRSVSLWISIVFRQQSSCSIFQVDFLTITNIIALQVLKNASYHCQWSIWGHVLMLQLVVVCKDVVSNSFLFYCFSFIFLRTQLFVILFLGVFHTAHFVFQLLTASYWLSMILVCLLLVSLSCIEFRITSVFLLTSSSWRWWQIRKWRMMKKKKTGGGIKEGGRWYIDLSACQRRIIRWSRIFGRMDDGVGMTLLVLLVDALVSLWCWLLVSSVQYTKFLSFCWTQRKWWWCVWCCNAVV